MQCLGHRIYNQEGLQIIWFTHHCVKPVPLAQCFTCSFPPTFLHTSQSTPSPIHLLHHANRSNSRIQPPHIGFQHWFFSLWARGCLRASLPIQDELDRLDFTNIDLKEEVEIGRGRDWSCQQITSQCGQNMNSSLLFLSKL